MKNVHAGIHCQPSHCKRVRHELNFESMPIYKIRDWEKLFETCETKKLVHLRWVPIPNKHDGKSFRRIASMENSSDIFTAWMLILQIASKCSPRGTLIDGNIPIDTEDMSIMTGFPEKIFKEALKVLSNGKIDWIEAVNPGESPGTPGESAAEGRKEGNRIEGKELGNLEGFSTFWEIYPKSVDKDACKKVWRSLKLDAQTIEKIILSVKVKLKDKEWTKDNCRFVPNPEKWLSGRRWEDEIKVNVSHSIKLRAAPQD